MRDQTTITINDYEYDAETITDLVDAVLQRGCEVAQNGDLTLAPKTHSAFSNHIFIDRAAGYRIEVRDIEKLRSRAESATGPDFETYLDDITPHYTEYIDPPKFEDEVDACARQKEFSATRMQTYSDDDGVQIGPVFEHNGQSCIGLVDQRSDE